MAGKKKTLLSQGSVHKNIKELIFFVLKFAPNPKVDQYKVEIEKNNIYQMLYMNHI